MNVNLSEKLTDAEMFDLGKTRNEQEWNEQEWNEVCSRVKAARGGHYPCEWFHRIVLSGFLVKTQATWGKS